MQDRYITINRNAIRLKIKQLLKKSIVESNPHIVEFILNKTMEDTRSTEAFLPLLSAINEIGGGKSFVPDLPPTNQPQKFAPVFIENQNKEPIRAYVVESDISNAQKRISRIERSTRF